MTSYTEKTPQPVQETAPVQDTLIQSNPDIGMATPEIEAFNEIAQSSPQVAQLREMKAAASSSLPNPPPNSGNGGLPNNLKSGIESLSGISMTDVKVHYNSPKPAKLGALAYAQGTNIHLGAGQEKHLAHEAWHVVQQKQGRVKANVQHKGALGKVGINDDKGLEHEADVMGAKAERISTWGGPLSLKNQSPGAGVTQLMTDNKDHFQEFLELKIQGKNVPPAHVEYLKAKAAAYILDHNAHKEKHKDLPFELFGVQDQLPDSGNPQDYLNILHGFIKRLGHNDISAITWGPLTDKNIGTGVHIVFGAGKEAKGTPADVKTPWMEVLSARKDGDRTLYVMGHLLNADLGGPGLDYNYVPLPGRAGWFGANDANGLHSKLIEQIVKQKYYLLGRGVTQLEYSVQAVPRAHARPETQEVRNTMTHMNAILAKRQFNGDTVLSRLPGAAKTILKGDIKANPLLEAVLYAVSSNNYWTRSWRALYQLVEANYNLWVLEDTMVPEALRTTARWVQDGIPQLLNIDIPIVLPNNVAAPYNSNKKSTRHKSSPELHSAQFQQFLHQKSDVSNPQLHPQLQGPASRAKAAAFLMDQNEYDREYMIDMFNNILRFNAIEQQLRNPMLVEAQREALTQQQGQFRFAVESLAQDPELAMIASNSANQQMVADLLQLPSRNLVDIIQQYITGFYQRSQKAFDLSTIAASGATPWGSPKKIVATLKPNGHPSGSSAGGDPGWMQILEERRDQSKTLYVRGHMLNRHLGGAGLDSNMVPLTGREGWFGANNANGIHSLGIEEQVKNLYKNMAKPGEEANLNKVTNLNYTIEAFFGNHNRPEKAAVIALTQRFSAIYQGVLASLTAVHEAKSGEEQHQTYLNYHTSDFIKLTTNNQQEGMNVLLWKIYKSNEATYGMNLDPTQNPLRSRIIQETNLANASSEQIVAAWRSNFAEADYQKIGDKNTIPAFLGQIDLKQKFSVPLAALAPAHQAQIEHGIQAVENLAKVLNAVSPSGNYKTESLLDLYSYMKSNAELWQYEDTNVPTEMKAIATWNQYGQGKTTGTITIPNRLPSDIGAPYISRFK